MSFYVFYLFVSLSIFILYYLYFDGIDDVDDEHFDAFSSGHSQFLAVSFDGSRLGGLGDKVPLSLDRFSKYIFFYSVHD